MRTLRTRLPRIPTRFTVAGMLCVLVLGLVLGSSAGAAAKSHPANFTIFYPLGTNRDPDIDTNFRLSLIYGRVGSVQGVDLNGGVSLIGRDLQGLQMTGLYSQVGGDFGGLAFTGLVNNFAGDVKGVQIAGLANIDRGDLTGLQYAGLFNFVEGELSGVQLTSVFNASHGEGGFLQIAGVANTHNGYFTGLQLGGANFVTGGLQGVQVGLGNVATEFTGGQIGLMNLARDAGGVQIGAVNFARDHYSVPIGLLNIDSDEGNADWLVFGSNLALAGTGVRTVVNNWYSMLWAGYGDATGDVEETAFFGWNYGYGFSLSQAWQLGLDLGFVHIIPDPNDDPNVNDRLQFALQARALVEYRFSAKVAAYAGGGVSTRYSEYSSEAEKETEAHFVAGVALF